MKIKNGTVFSLVNNSATGESLLQKLSSARMRGGNVCYNRNRTVKAINDQYKEIEALRIDLIKKYGDEEKGIDPKDVEAFNAFMNDFNEILGIEEDLDIRKIPLDALDEIDLDFYEMDMLEFMIDLPEEEEFVVQNVVD